MGHACPRHHLHPWPILRDASLRDAPQDEVVLLLTDAPKSITAGQGPAVIDRLR